MAILKIGALTLMFFLAAGVSPVTLPAEEVPAQETAEQPSEEAVTGEETALEPEAEPAETPSQEPPAKPAVAAVTAEKAPAVAACVAPVQDLEKFFLEQASLARALVQTWNSRVLSYGKRNEKLKEEAASLEKKLADLQGADDKESRKEASRVEKRLKRVRKEQGIQAGELREQCSELVKALKSFGRDVQEALKAKLADIQGEVAGTEKE